MHDQTAVKIEAIADLLAQHPTVRVRVDEAQSRTKSFDHELAGGPQRCWPPSRACGPCPWPARC
jgi:hypothetical protein